MAYCPSMRLVASGSVQSKAQALETLTAAGVGVSCRSLGSGAFVWSVTFLDAGGDFELSPVLIGADGTTSALTGLSGRRAVCRSLIGADDAVVTAKV